MQYSCWYWYACAHWLRVSAESPGADVARASPVPVQMWHGRALTGCVHRPRVFEIASSNASHCSPWGTIGLADGALPRRLLPTPTSVVGKSSPAPRFTPYP